MILYTKEWFFRSKLIKVLIWCKKSKHSYSNNSLCVLNSFLKSFMGLIFFFNTKKYQKLHMMQKPKHSFVYNDLQLLNYMQKPWKDRNHVVGNGIRSLNEIMLGVRGNIFLYMIMLLHWLFDGIGRRWFANIDLSSTTKWVILQLSKS